MSLLSTSERAYNDMLHLLLDVEDYILDVLLVVIVLSILNISPL